MSLVCQQNKKLMQIIQQLETELELYSIGRRSLPKQELFVNKLSFILGILFTQNVIRASKNWKKGTKSSSITHLFERPKVCNLNQV